MKFILYLSLFFLPIWIFFDISNAQDLDSTSLLNYESGLRSDSTNKKYNNRFLLLNKSKAIISKTESKIKSSFPTIPEKLKSPIPIIRPRQPSGNIQVEGLYRLRSGNDTLMAPSYLRLSGRIEIDIMGSPIIIKPFFSSEDSRFRQPVTGLSIEFDLQSIKKKYISDIQNQIKIIEQQIEPTNLRLLDKMYPESPQINFNKFNELRNSFSTQVDSISRRYSVVKDKISGSFLNLSQWARQRLNTNKNKQLSWSDTLSILFDKRSGISRDSIENIIAITNSIQDSLQKAKNRVSYLNQFDVPNHVDSLLRTHPKIMAKYENLRQLRALKKQIQGGDWSKAYGKLKMSKFSQFTTHFNTIQILRATPNFSSLVLKSMPIWGVNLEASYSKFLIGFAGGVSQIATSIDSSRRQGPFGNLSTGPFNGRWVASYNQRIVGARIGYGKWLGNQVLFTILWADDKKGGFSFDSSRTQSGRNSPQSNLIYGLSFKQRFEKIGLDINGELFSSLLSRNKISHPYTSTDAAWWLLFTPRNENQEKIISDLAAKFIIIWKYDRTQVSIKLSHLGARYYSLANPFIPNGRTEYGVVLIQQLKQAKMKLTFEWMNQHQRNTQFGPGQVLNVLLKGSATAVPVKGLQLSLNLVTLHFLKYNQSEIGQLLYANRSLNLTGVYTHSFVSKRKSMHSIVSPKHITHSFLFSYLMINQVVELGNNSFIHQLSISQLLNFEKGYAFGIQYSLQKDDSAGGIRLGVTPSIQFPNLKIVTIRLSAGVDYLINKAIRSNIEITSEFKLRRGFGLTLCIGRIDVHKIGSTASVEPMPLGNIIPFSEFIFRSGLKYMF